MLRISEMELVGFKSFSDRAALSFTGGVTAVVGPNGCGKSNISDALSWVLGEQSARSLRGGKMEDVIFNGSSERKAVGMAEVSLKLQAPKADAEPGDDAWDEILLTRRLFRDGQSEYAMDGKRCRLLDIEDRLYGHGIDGKAYAIIEQGRIGLILSGRGADRRLLIEEAAGIHHYKGKKHQAELRLEASATNLARIDDIIGEVKRQLGSLKRQAARAERFKEMRESHRRVERILFARQYRGRRGALQDLEGRHAAGADRLASDLAALTAAEAAAEACRGERMEAERELTAARDVLHDVQLRIERKEAEARQCQGEIQDLASRSSAAHEGLSGTVVRISESAAERERLSTELAERVEELRVRDEELGKLKDATRDLMERTRAQEAALEAHKDGLFGAANALSAVRNSLQKLSALAEKARSTEAKHDFELKGIQLERGRLDAAGDEIRARTLTGSEEVARLSAQLAALREEGARVKERVAAATQEQAEARSARDQAHHRLQSLQEIEDRHWGYEEGVRSFYEKHPDMAALAQGIVADHLQVTERYEAAVEAALQEALQWVVVSDIAQARASARVLGGAGEGRVGFLPLDGPMGAVDAAPLDPVEPALGRVAGFVSVMGSAPVGLAGRLALALPDAYVVEDIDQAWDLVARYPLVTAVTLGGDVVRQGAVLVAGRRGGPGILTVKREIRDLSVLLGELGERSARCDAEQAAAVQLDRDIDRGQRETDEARRLAERQHLTLSHELEQIHKALDRLAQRQDVLAMELEEVRRELTTYLTEEQELAREEVERVAVVATMEEERLSLQDALREIRDRLPQARADEDAAAAAVGSSREARARSEAELVAVTQRAQELEGALERLRRDLEGMEERSRKLSERLAQAGEEMGTLAVKQEQAAAAAREREDVREGLAGREEDLAGELKARRTDHEAAREQLQALDVERAQVEAELRHLEERCRMMLNATIEDVEATLTPEEEGEPEDELATEASRLAERIEALGPVNLMAIEEARELEERHDFLTRQREDVSQSIDDIRKAIRKINETSRERFLEAFHEINRHFQEAFLALFGGGSAELRLTGDDVLEAGVEVVAQPPGKRLQSIQLMSGGEKALSALALLFGIFQFRPSPFCVLDEVDAPLDEANVERFTNLLRKMQDRTQFILITHNKTTMEIAEQLYGISMDEPGVSRVYSVRLGAREEVGGNGNGGNGHGASATGGGNGGGHGSEEAGPQGKRGNIRSLASMRVRRRPSAAVAVEEPPGEPGNSN